MNISAKYKISPDFYFRIVTTSLSIARGFRNTPHFRNQKPFVIFYDEISYKDYSYKD